MGTSRITVLLADDSVIAREGWKAILKTAGDIQVIGEAESAQETVRRVLEQAPDVVLMDLRWLGDPTAGWSAIKEIKTARPEVKVIAVTAYEDLIPDARRAGADAALLKTFTRDQLLRLIRELATRERSFPVPEPGHSLLDTLTPREREVLKLLADGCTDGEIARKLTIAESTVKNHVSSILSKLGVKNRTQAAKVVHQMGGRI